ncbi:MAG: RsbRD N-terminal domain-containing protein [Desulfohalobiaceae bacterium]|nr:RsbRD N-terminal domain-containing protein [Desulfohalobiaceae bacterium]
MEQDTAESLNDLFSRDRKFLIKAWVEKALATYPPKTSEIFKNQKDQFANPVGATLNRSLEGIFDQLLLETSTEDVHSHVEGLVKVRAVQDFTPSGAVSFLLDLKKIIRRRCGREISESGLEPALFAFEERIDLVCLLAFDLFMKQREKIWQLRSQELQQRASYLLRKKAGIVPIDPEE